VQLSAGKSGQEEERGAKFPKGRTGDRKRVPLIVCQGAEREEGIRSSIVKRKV